MRISSPFPTVSDLLILNSCRLHFLIDHILNLFRYLGLLTEDPIGTNYTPVASGCMSHRRRRSYYIRQMLSLIHLGHEFVQLVVAVSLDLFEEIVHFKGLSIARDLTSCENILGMLRQTHVILLELVLD